jgi:uncharacterized protein with PQ loop repeat
MFSYYDQEVFGWVGSSIFIIAQLSQIIHTFKIKETKDISFILYGMFFIGNIMYTTFGYLDDSLSMFLGNFISLTFTIMQISQKIYYDKYYNYTNYDLIR